MRFVTSKHPIPRCFMRHPKGKHVVAEADIAPHPYGRLMAKLVVFDTAPHLRKFWREAIGNNLGKGCVGAVNCLGIEGEEIDGWKQNGPKRMHGDPRYFCIIGLCRTNLTMEVISHESVHAGFAYERRVKRNLFGEAADFSEERIAYPAGAVAAAINRFVHRKGLYPKS